ncbi:hypothetical protein T459_29410 [Capsicum annuum]|uniref:Nuclear condensin complex subunit 3 C-terminal domain-containing protein n=1 Tax=Capsicum annuum TaxID=4072 RepID=A0A2G2Y5F9_CAPAN|nr:hypothetical protein T459_29410 [Capsicum annuum]
MASKALIDLGLWNGPNNYLLYDGLEKHNSGDSEDYDEHETVQTVLGEGFAKILLLSKKYPHIPTLSNPLLLAKLISLYFCSENKELESLPHGLKLCLSVFFEHYPSLSMNHKKCLSKAFMPVMRSLWPGINGNATGSTYVASNMRKSAIQASRFMVQMMQAPFGEEGLAIRIAAEVVSFPAKKTAAEKAYVSALCKTLFLLHFRPTDQGAVKLMRQLLSRVTVLAEKELLKGVETDG